MQGDIYRVEGSLMESRPGMTSAVAERGSSPHRAALPTNFSLLPPDAQRTEVEIYDGLMERGARPAWAVGEAHRELAAAIIAVGGTLSEAADHAGVSEPTVRGYQSEDDFRQRVLELRSFVTSRISGRILNRLDVLTDKDHIEDLPVKDLLAIHDRTSGTRPGSPAGVTINVQQNSYEAVLASLSRLDPGEEGAAFPTYGADVIPVPGGGTRSVRTVPALGHGPESGEVGDGGS